MGDGSHRETSAGDACCHPANHWEAPFLVSGTARPRAIKCVRMYSLKYSVLLP